MPVETMLCIKHLQPQLFGSNFTAKFQNNFLLKFGLSHATKGDSNFKM